VARGLIPGVLVALLLAAPAPAASLSGTKWRVTRVAGKPVAAELKLTLEFPGAKKFAGYDGCNWFGGRYTATAARLRFRGLFSTAIGCDFALPGLTTRLLRTRRYRLEGKRLELRRRGRALVVLRRR
jgi:heat shock protein HslJ